MISSRASPASAGNSGHSATAQLDRAPGRRCVASAAVAGRVALSSWLFLPVALYCCVTHEQTSFSTAAYANHPCLAISTLARCLSAIARMRTGASRVLLMPSPAVCLLLLSKLCLSQCHTFLTSYSALSVRLLVLSKHGTASQCGGTSLNPVSQWYPGESGRSRPKVALVRHSGTLESSSQPNPSLLLRHPWRRGLQRRLQRAQRHALQGGSAFIQGALAVNLQLCLRSAVVLQQDTDRSVGNNHARPVIRHEGRSAYPLRKQIGQLPCLCTHVVAVSVDAAVAKIQDGRE